MVVPRLRFRHARRREGRGGHLKRVPRSSSERVAALLALFTIFVSVSLLNIPYFALEPGPSEDVSRLIGIEGVKTSPVKGKLLLTTVSLHMIRVGEAVRGWIDPAITIVSRSAIIPSGESEENVQQRTTEQMEESQLLATAAALDLLGYDVRVESAGVRIRDVAEDAPAAHLLRRGDVIVEADGKPVRQTEDLVNEVRRHGVGQSVRLSLERGQEKLDVTVRTVGRPQDPSEPVIGVVIDTVPQIELPLAVEIDSLGIGGPSAGLMFAIGIVDLIDPDDVTKGRVVAGTGEIGLQGDVRPVGGIRQKVTSARRAGAEMFIVPGDELDDACTVARDLTVVGVGNLSDAVETLKGGEIAADRTCPK